MTLNYINSSIIEQTLRALSRFLELWGFHLDVIVVENDHYSTGLVELWVGGLSALPSSLVLSRRVGPRI